MAKTIALTSVQKGKITRAVNSKTVTKGSVFQKTWAVFQELMPREQAKHATRRYLAANFADFAR